MKRKISKYRKSKKTPLHKEWNNKIKLHGGSYFPECNCCNNNFGPIHFKNNKKLIHRFIRRVDKQKFIEEIKDVV